LSETALLQAIVQLSDCDYAEELRRKALQVFDKNHNLDKQTVELIQSLTRISCVHRPVSEEGLQTS
jgi:Ca2+-binding EF-hand superfamily protein